ncbi:MAG: TrkA family potassium uptake protein [Chloroflexi bacterium]|nr:TrkA family potassium uptake protein [Chloroflexota bacterium]
MYVIIAGGGEVGYYLAKEFVESGHEVLVIERESKQRERLEGELGDITLCGEGCRIQCLDEAGVSRADVFIAATDTDEDNLAACQLAKLKYGVPRVVAKLNNPRNRNIFRKLGIEHTVDVAALVLENLKARIPAYPFVHLLSLEEESLEVVQVSVTDDSRLSDRVVAETPLSFLVESACLVRAGSPPQVVGDATRLAVGDKLICVVAQDKADKLRTVVGGVVGPQD